MESNQKVVWLYLNCQFQHTQRLDMGPLNGMEGIFSLVGGVKNSYLLGCVFEKGINS